MPRDAAGLGMGPLSDSESDSDRCGMGLPSFRPRIMQPRGSADSGRPATEMKFKFKFKFTGKLRPPMRSSRPAARPGRAARPVLERARPRSESRAGARGRAQFTVLVGEGRGPGCDTAVRATVIPSRRTSTVPSRRLAASRSSSSQVCSPPRPHPQLLHRPAGAELLASPAPHGGSLS